MRRILSIFVVAFFATFVAACGGVGGGGGLDSSPGVGTITLISFSPSPVLGCAPTPFTITGTNFETVTGTTAIITFHATTGAPFGGSSTATVIGDVQNDGTITGTTPAIDLCGVPAVTLSVDVTLESGVKASDSGPLLFVNVNAPTITSILPNPIPAAIPTAFTISGTGFSPTGGQVTIRFTSANAGDLNFADGTANFADVQGTITGAGTITGESPVARACTANFNASVQLLFPDGCCTAPTATNFVTFLAPTITAGSVAVPAEIPTLVVITGTNFGVVGETGTVRLTAAIPLFGGGTLQTVDVPGLVGAGSTSFSFTTPLAAVCGISPPVASIRWIAPRGESCAQNGAVNLTFNFPTLTSISTPTVPSLVSTPFTLTGTGFPAVGSNITLRFLSAGALEPIFADGTANSIDVTGTVTSSTTITGNTPLATLCGLDSIGSGITAFFPGGSCAMTSAVFFTYLGPSLTALSPGGIQNPNLPVASFPNNNVFSHFGSEPFVLNATTGRNFGEVGAVVQVRFSTIGFGTPFQGGAQDYDTVLGQVTSATTITGATPQSVSPTTAIMPVTVQAFWEDGTCSNTATAQYVQTTQRTFVTGTSIHTVNQNGLLAPTSIATAVTGVTPGVDARRNRLYTLGGGVPTFLVYDTGPTMLGTPTAPISLPTGGLVLSTAVDLAVASDKGVVWVTNGTSDNIAIVSQANNTVLFAPFATPAGSNPQRVIYNAAAGEMVVAFFGTSQVAVYNATNGNLVSLYTIPQTDANFGGANEIWNGVMGLRPTASGDARVYTVHDEGIFSSPDAICTLQLSTGSFSAVPVDFSAAVAPSQPSALAYDTFRDQLVWWRGDSVALAPVLERRDPVSLTVLDAILHPGNVLSISVDPLDDRYYLSNSGTGNLDAVGGTPLGTFTSSLALPVTGSNASTSR